MIRPRRVTMLHPWRGPAPDPQADPLGARTLQQATVRYMVGLFAAMVLLQRFSSIVISDVSILVVLVPAWAGWGLLRGLLVVDRTRLLLWMAATERVELFADVPDLTPYLNRTSVALNPVVSGSGVNIKLIDYLDAGLPLVSTSLATAGLPLEAGGDLEVHDDPQEFAAAVLRLVDDPTLAGRLARSGRRHLRELLDAPTNLARIGDLLSPRRSASPTA